MARIRTIKPEFFTNEEVAAVSFEWRLLFVGLWLHADREGRLQDRPARLKAMLFPYDDLSVETGLGCLANEGLIVRYEGDGMRLIAIPGFSKHQQPHIKEAESVLPAPPNDQKHGASTLLQPVEPVGREGKGTDQERNGSVITALRARFDLFWSVYPRKVAKDAALKEWLKRSPDDALTERMIVAVNRHKASPQWTKDGGQFIPHARTWLSQGRWQDEDVIRLTARDNNGEVASSSKSWVCPHVDHCSHRGMCKNKTLMGPEKYPVKKAAS